MLREIGKVKAAVLAAGADGDFAWLVEVFEALVAEHPERAELLRSGIASLEVAMRLRERLSVWCCAELSSAHSGAAVVLPVTA